MESIVRNSLGGTLERLRVENGWTQQELADRIYCSRATIGHIETGRREPSLSTLRRLADIFGTDINILVNS